MVAMVTEGTARRVLTYRYKEDQITFELTLQPASSKREKLTRYRRVPRC